MKNWLLSLFFIGVTTLSAVEAHGFYGQDLTNIPESNRIAGAPKSAVPLKVFFLLPGKVSAAVNEMKLRRDLTPVILQTESYVQYSPWYKKPQKVYALAVEEKQHKKIEADRLKQLKDCDVIVLGKIDLNILPPHVTKAIFDRVKQGAGLLYIKHEIQNLPERLRTLMQSFQ